MLKNMISNEMEKYLGMKQACDNNTDCIAVKTKTVDHWALRGSLAVCILRLVISIRYTEIPGQNYKKMIKLDVRRR